MAYGESVGYVIDDVTWPVAAGGVARGVYPYLPMATNAPWSILGGMKNQFWGGMKKFY